MAHTTALVLVDYLKAREFPCDSLVFVDRVTRSGFPMVIQFFHFHTLFALVGKVSPLGFIGRTQRDSENERKNPDFVLILVVGYNGFLVA